jgi:hypothetical protein
MWQPFQASPVNLVGSRVRTPSSSTKKSLFLNRQIPQVKQDPCYK